jgi:peroxiredoxin
MKPETTMISVKVKPWITAMLMLMAPVLANAQKEKIPKEIMVRGKVEFRTPDPAGNKIWLMKQGASGKEVAVDSCMLNADNTFSFKLRQDHPGIYEVDVMHWDRAPFWSDADVSVQFRGYDTAKMHMKIPHYDYVEGSMDNAFVNLYEQLGSLDYLRMIDEYNEVYYADQAKATDSAWSHYLHTRKRYDSLNTDFHQRVQVLVNAFKNRPVVIYAIRGMAGTEDHGKYDSAMALLDNLARKYPWLSEASEIKANITRNRELARKLKPGEPMPAVSYPDALGTLQGLEKYKGKYLLIDFWASWCGPCRQAIPKVKALYRQFHEKGFDVVSISIDTDKNAWKKAMKEEDMPWEQLLSDNKDTTMEAFQFSGIPTLYVVDKEGKIVTKYSGYGPDTEAAIKSLLENGTVSTRAAEGKKSIPMTSF